MEGALASGLLTGLIVGVGFLMLRFKAWPLSQALGVLSAGALLLGVVAVGIVGLGSLGGGGDAVIAGMTALVILVVGLGVSMAVGGLIALVQCGRIGQTWRSTLLTISPEPLLIVAAAWTFQALVTSPMERQTTDTWWQQEQARRNRIEKLKNEIPAKYRDYDPVTIAMIERNEKWVTDHGGKIKPTFPPGIADRIREYRQAAAEPEVVADRSGYLRAQEARSGFITGLGIGWLAGALAGPLALKRRPKPIRKPPVLAQKRAEPPEEPAGFEL